MKTKAILTAGVMALGLGGCAAGLIAADMAAEVALLYMEDDGTAEVMDVGVPIEECEDVARDLNALARQTGEQADYACVLVPEEVQVGPLTEPEFDVIMGD